MNKEIEEMARTMCGAFTTYSCEKCHKQSADAGIDCECACEVYAIILYEAGYRECDCDACLVEIATRKNTARDILQKTKEIVCANTFPSFGLNGKPCTVWNTFEGYNAIDKIAKEYGIDLTEKE